MAERQGGAGQGRAVHPRAADEVERATLTLDDAGVVIHADTTAADLLGCRVRDLVGKPFVIFVAASHRRELYVALRHLRDHDTGTELTCGLASRDPVKIDASVAFTPGPQGIRVVIGDVVRSLDPDRLVERLQRTRARQRELVATLGTVMRPRRVALPDLDVGAEPGACIDDAPTRVLHDWRLLPSGDLLLFVVAAHGADPMHREAVQAIRDTVRALTLAGNPPSELFSRVERICGLRAAGAIASAVVAYCAPDGSQAVVVSAGGPRPVVRRAGGHVERVGSRGLALGDHGRPAQAFAKVPLAHGDALVLYGTAGSERHGSEDPSAVLERRLAGMEPRQLGGAATARQLIDPQTPHGTTAVVCAVRGSISSTSAVPGPQLRISLSKDEMRDVGRSRRELAIWLSRRAVRAETIDRALLVVSELTTNAVSAATGRAELRVSVHGGVIHLEVTDDGGSWHPESGLRPDSDGGFGLRVASSLCEDLHVAASAAGTVIRARVGARSAR
jgi:anti-sigma regulatory factor (Ser/Thr protein kinase)